MSTYGEKTTQALSAFLNVPCPGLGDIVIGDPCDQSGNITEEFGTWIDSVEQADLSCDEVKASFQIHIYFLPEIKSLTRDKSLDDVKINLKSQNSKV